MNPAERSCSEVDWLTSDTRGLAGMLLTVASMPNVQRNDRESSHPVDTPTTTRGSGSRMSRWICPTCEREFGAVNQAHTCAPGITVVELLARHPPWVADIYAVVIETVRALGPVHEDAVNVGIFLKASRKFVEFRPRVRSVMLWILLPEEHPVPAVGRVIRAGLTYAHGVVLTAAIQVDEDVRELVELAYDFAAD